MNFLSKEYYSAINIIVHFLENNTKCLGNSNYFINKLNVLDLAKHAGLDVPCTLITSEKNILIKFFNTKRKIITKGIRETFSVLLPNEISSYSYTNEIQKKHIDNLSNKFFSSLFQEKLNKKFELRIFYLCGKFYSMAIFSQEDKQTKTDFRRYNDKKPNRNVPFKLPKKIKTKINKLMCDLKLNTGSIDMIYTKDKKYVFLEINPVGQFGMVSYPCNYFIEKEIAVFLKPKIPNSQN